MEAPASNVELHVGLVANLVRRSPYHHVAIARILVGLASADEAVEDVGRTPVVVGIAFRSCQGVT